LTALQTNQDLQHRGTEEAEEWRERKPKPLNRGTLRSTEENVRALPLMTLIRTDFHCKTKTFNAEEQRDQRKRGREVSKPKPYHRGHGGTLRRARLQI
jgi:hypothetical protein